MSRLPIGRRTLAIVAVLVGLAACRPTSPCAPGHSLPSPSRWSSVETGALRLALFGVGNVEARQLYRSARRPQGVLRAWPWRWATPSRPARCWPRWTRLTERRPPRARSESRRQRHRWRGSQRRRALARQAYGRAHARRTDSCSPRRLHQRGTARRAPAQDLQLAVAVVTDRRAARMQSRATAPDGRAGAARAAQPTCVWWRRRQAWSFAATSSPAPPWWRARRSSSSSIRSHCGSTSVSTRSAPAADGGVSRHGGPAFAPRPDRGRRGAAHRTARGLP